MLDKVQVGLIGTSWWTEGFYIPSLKSHSDAVIVAICGRNQAKAEALAHKHNIPHVFTDYTKMLNSAMLDAVVIATPDDLHFPMTMKSLEKGLHVICEKAMALSAKDARIMLEKAESRGVKHMIMFTNRWFPHFQYLKHLIDGGYVGEIYQGHFHHLTPAPSSGDYCWYYDPERSQGVLSVVGSHIIDLARLLIGDIKRISASLSTFIERPGKEGNKIIGAPDSALLLLEFENGSHGSIHLGAVNLVAKGLSRTGICIELYGSEGSIELSSNATSQPPTAELRGIQIGEKEAKRLKIPDEYFKEINPEVPFEVFLKHSVGPRLFIDAIVNDISIEPNFYDGYKVQQVIDAAIESYSTGQTVSVENV
ncbi:Gfo/Idh/MocA family oxidoreductase [Candidatus Sumerlaeota bacterium]|nr:Gfo/Idh/MocA family oxidoreductase [Candidatus Sumerlaeota bacterium]